MTREEIKLELKKVLTPKRYVHSVNVMNTAVKLAKKYGADSEKAATAGLLHDCAREINGDEVFRLCEKYSIEVNYITRMQPELLHGPIGSAIAREKYGITDEDILGSIYCHTTGRENMSILDKIIFIADYIEPNRNFLGIDEVRSMAFSDIDRAVVLSLDRTIKYVISKGALIYPDTISARNFIIFNCLKERRKDLI